MRMGHFRDLLFIIQNNLQCVWFVGFGQLPVIGCSGRQAGRQAIGL